MHSSAARCLPIAFVGLLLLLLVLCTVPISLSANGSIQPFFDAYCQSPRANATHIPYTSSTDCQHTKNSAGTPIALLYHCNSTGFQLAHWYNSTQCSSVGQATSRLVTGAIGSGCPVVRYEDAGDSFLFYAHIECYSVSERSELGVDGSIESLVVAMKQSVVESVRTGLGRREQRSVPSEQLHISSEGTGQ